MATETSLKYRDLIAPKSDKQIEEEELKHKVEESQYILGGAITSAKQALAKAEQHLAAARKRSPLDPQILLDSLYKRDDLKEKVAYLETEQKALFG